MSTSRAMAIMASWLKGAEVPHRVEVESSTVWVGDTSYRIVDGPASEQCLSASELEGENGLKVFESAVQRAGFQPKPIFRGTLDKEYFSAKDDWDLVAMRHREFRVAPDPTPEDWKRFRPVAEVAARKFCRMNPGLCQRLQFEYEDVLQYALLWTVNFLHKYRLLQDSGTENERLLMAHLRQRYAELAKLMEKRDANTNVTLDTLKVALYEGGGARFIAAEPTMTVSAYCRGHTGVGQDDLGRSAIVPFWDSHPAEREEWVPGASKGVDTKNPTARKRTARKMLEEGLAAMPQEQRIEKLLEVANSPAVSTDAARVARRYLRANGVDLRDTDVDEDVPSVDAPSA